MRRSLAALALAVVLPLPGLAPSAALADVVVKPGETLSEIADRHGVSLTRLMQANGISNPNVVAEGQKLVLPGARSSASAAAPRPLPTAPYTIKSGETLSEIADRFGTSTERLIQLNRIANQLRARSTWCAAVKASPPSPTATACPLRSWWPSTRSTTPTWSSPAPG
jgi:LysM repeat protein